MHPFLSPENFKKTLRCFHVSRAQRKGELGTNALILERMSWLLSHCELSNSTRKTLKQALRCSSNLSDGVMGQRL